MDEEKKSRFTTTLHVLKSFRSTQFIKSETSSVGMTFLENKKNVKTPRSDGHFRCGAKNPMLDVIVIAFILWEMWNSNSIELNALKNNNDNKMQCWMIGKKVKELRSFYKKQELKIPYMLLGEGNCLMSYSNHDLLGVFGFVYTVVTKTFLKVRSSNQSES